MKNTAHTSPPDWTPPGWRARPATQMPAYNDAAALDAAIRHLSAAPALVTPAACRALLQRTASVANGNNFLLQGGDCAESFGGFSAPRVQATVDTLRALATRLGPHVTLTARLAGQFAKPRSADTETRGGLTLPVYRGDSINDFAFTAHARTADPARMVQAYEQSAATLAQIPDGLFTCHEALLLPYEESLTRRDPETGAWYATSAHFLWLGARTQRPDGAHAEYLRGIANPIGVKCAPWTDADMLLRLLDVLDPDHIPGRLTLIPRMGAAAIDDCLPPLIDAVKRAAHRRMVLRPHARQHDFNGVRNEDPACGGYRRGNRPLLRHPPRGGHASGRHSSGIDRHGRHRMHRRRQPHQRCRFVSKIRNPLRPSPQPGAG